MLEIRRATITLALINLIFPSLSFHNSKEDLTIFQNNYIWCAHKILAITTHCCAATIIILLSLAIMTTQKYVVVNYFHISFFLCF